MKNLIYIFLLTAILINSETVYIRGSKIAYIWLIAVYTAIRLIKSSGPPINYVDH